jgi:RNA polymerase sigma-70 factor, ECF subfamily
MTAAPPPRLEPGDADGVADPGGDPGPRRRVPLQRVVERVLHMGVVASAERSPDRVVDQSARRGTGRSGDRSSAAGLGRERPSFERFYESQYATVTRLAYSLCGSLAVAEELAQEAFVAAHARWRRISLFDRPDLWVRRVVINRSLSYRRRLASERIALERVSQAPTSPNEPDLADDEIWQALRSLSDRQTEVLALVYVEDRPIAEVAEILRLGEETIRTHLKRGRAALATRLGEREHRDIGR